MWRHTCGQVLVGPSIQTVFILTSQFSEESACSIVAFTQEPKTCEQWWQLQLFILAIFKKKLDEERTCNSLRRSKERHFDAIGRLFCNHKNYRNNVCRIIFFSSNWLEQNYESGLIFFIPKKSYCCKMWKNRVKTEMSWNRSSFETVSVTTVKTGGR